jgi:transposase-like protein
MSQGNHKDFGGDIMGYSDEFRNRVLREILPPNNRSVEEVCAQFGVSAWSVHRWKRAAKEGMLCGGAQRPSERPLAEKLTLLLEGTALPEEQRGEWLRAQGLHTEHLSLYEQEIRQSMTEKEKRQREEILQLRKDKKALERELRRKDSALAEMTALVALKKKLEVIFGEDEEA